MCRQSLHCGMNKAHALLFALMMMTVSLAGCFGGDDGDSNDEISSETLDDWQVHFAASSSDLPECNDDTNGRLYYVATHRANNPRPSKDARLFQRLSRQPRHRRRRSASSSRTASARGAPSASPSASPRTSAAGSSASSAWNACVSGSWSRRTSKGLTEVGS